jgi:hypothetical protein
VLSTSLTMPTQGPWGRRWEARTIVGELELLHERLTGELASRIESQDLYEHALFVKDAEAEIERLVGEEA